MHIIIHRICSLHWTKNTLEGGQMINYTKYSFGIRVDSIDIWTVLTKDIYNLIYEYEGTCIFYVLASTFCHMKIHFAICCQQYVSYAIINYTKLI